MFYRWDAFCQSLLNKYSIVLYCYRFFAVPVNKVLSDLMAYSVSCRMVQVADRVFRRLATRCQYDTVRSQLLSVAGRRPADSWRRWSGWTSRIRLQQNLADDGLYSLLVCWYFHCRLLLLLLTLVPATGFLRRLSASGTYTIRKKSLTWTQNLSDQRNLAHVARKNEKEDTKTNRRQCSLNSVQI